MKFEVDQKSRAETRAAEPGAVPQTAEAETNGHHYAPRSSKAVPHKLRSRQRLSLSAGSREACYQLADGLVLVEAQLDRDRPHIACVCFRGDTLIPSTLPPLAKPSIICASRLALVLERPVGADTMDVTSDALMSEMTYNAARAALQATILATLASEERVATLLVEFALRSGRMMPDGCMFDMPLSRTDIGLYLGLNPDTVSRNFATLKAEGLVQTFGRSSVSCANLDALMARSPVSDVLKGLIAQRRSARATLR